MRLAPTLATTLLLVVPLPAHAERGGAPDAPPPPATSTSTTSSSAADLDRQLAALVTAGGLTADGAAARAAGASPEVERRAAAHDAAGARARLAGLSWIPRLVLDASYTRLSDVEFPSLTLGGAEISFATPLDSWHVGAALSIPLSDYVTRVPHLVAAAELSESAARISEAAAVLAAATRARVAFYEWIRARHQVVVAGRLVDQVDRNLEQVRTFADAGTASRADVLRLEAAAAAAAEARLRAEHLAATREQQLRLAIGAPDREPIAIGEDVSATPSGPPLGRLSELIDRANDRRLELAAIDAAIDAVERGGRVIRAAELPRLDGFARLDYDNPNPRIVPAQDDFELTWAVGLRLSWTVDEVLRVNPALDEHDASVRRLIADRDELTDAIELEVATAARAVGLAQRTLVAADDGLAAAEESYRVRRELFDAEGATTVELIDAETELTRARIAAIDARIDLRIALARLAHATGQDIW